MWLSDSPITWVVASRLQQKSMTSATTEYNPQSPRKPRHTRPNGPTHICKQEQYKSLETVCCKKRHSSWPVTGLGNKDPLKVLNGTELILDDHGNNLDLFRISMESFRSFRGCLLHKPVTGQKLFFAVSYSKPVIVLGFRWVSNWNAQSKTLTLN